MENKKKVFKEIEQYLGELGLRIHTTDQDRPWGGFFVIEEEDAEKFIQHFFPSFVKDETLGGKLSPKILLVGPQKKLSWQYHFRRSEIWKLIRGEAAVIKSDTDEETEKLPMSIGETITLKKGERHRLVGINDWGVVAEIWIHTDKDNPSNEEDIVRLQDDFGR